MPRPPILTIYNMDGTISSFPGPPDLTHLTDTINADELSFALIPRGMPKNENCKPNTHNLELSDLKRRDVIFDKQYMGMCNDFRERPLIVNLMQTSPSRRSPLPDDTQSPDETNHRAASPTIDDEPSDPSAGPHEMDGTHSPELHAEANLQSHASENGVAYGSMEDGGTGSAAHNRHSVEDLNISQPSSSANAENSSTNEVTSARVFGSLDESPYDIIEGPGRSIARLTHYVDIRAKLTPEQSNALANTMVEGSEVIFVGLTRLPDGSKYEFELPTNCRYLVAEIYGDFWALLIKLERGLELGETEPSSFFGWRSKPKPPRKSRMPEKKALIGARSDRRFFVYAPLCAFTLAVDGASGSQPELNDSIASDSTSPYGGLAQASIRTHSETAEADAIYDRFTFIAQEVYDKYVELCKSSQQELAATNEPPPPTGTEISGPSLRSNAQASQFHTCNRNTNVASRQKVRVSQPHRSTKSAKNTPTQNIKEFFSRKKEGKPVAVPTTKFDEPRRTPEPNYGDGAGSPQEESVFVAASAPQIQLSSLPLLFENVSMDPASSSSEHFSPNLNGTQPQRTEPLVRDTTLTGERTPLNDNMASARRDSRQSSAELSIPHRRSYMRSSSSDPTPKPIQSSPLAQTPSLANGSEATQDSVSGKGFLSPY